jgi:hypothetical protein
MNKCPYCGKPVEGDPHPHAKVYHMECAMEMCKEQREKLRPIAEWKLAQLQK